MVEAKIILDNTSVHYIKASNLKVLKARCLPYINDPSVLSVTVYRKTFLRSFKLKLDGGQHE